LSEFWKAWIEGVGMSLNGCNNNNNPQDFGSAFPCEEVKTAAAVFFMLEKQVVGQETT
jgi:hypothetical protein